MWNAFPAPHMPEEMRPWRVQRDLNVAEFKTELMNWDDGHFGKGMRGEVVYDEPAWTDTWEPLIRADFKLFDEYKLKHDVEADKFDFPIFSFFCEGEYFLKSDMVE